MNETIIPVNNPRLRITDKGNGANCVRAYRSDPEGITLQIRMNGRYVTAWLPFIAARTLANGILDHLGQP